MKEGTVKLTFSPEDIGKVVQVEHGLETEAVTVGVLLAYNEEKIGGQFRVERIFLQGWDGFCGFGEGHPVTNITVEGR